MAVTTPATESVNSKLIDPGVKKYWYDSFKELAPRLSSVFNVSKIDGAYEEHMAYAGLGDMPLVEEGGTFPEDAVLATYGTTFYVYKWGYDIPVSYELYDDQREKIAGKTSAAAKAMARKVEKLAAGTFNDYGFVTPAAPYSYYGDGKPLFSTDHTRVDGGSAQSNASATGITLTEANLETGILAMQNQLDDRGNLKNIVPNTLVVPPALEKEALIYTKSDGRPTTADNDKNVYAMKEYTGGMLNVIVWNYLGSAAGGSDTAWYLLDSTQHQLTWMWRIRPNVVMLDAAAGAKNQIWYWQAYFRAAFGWSDWRGAWGSLGDGAAYAS